MDDSSSDATRLLEQVNAGGPAGREAMAALLPLVYQSLREQAASYLQRERADHTLQPTALVHEAYLKLVDQTRVRWESSGHFKAIAARAMRQVLVNHARDRKRLKRGGDRNRIPLDENLAAAAGDLEDVDLVLLDESLEKLATIDERKVQIVEARFFAGMSVEETAASLNISPATVKRDWEFTRTWLLSDMQRRSSVES